MIRDLEKLGRIFSLKTKTDNEGDILIVVKYISLAQSEKKTIEKIASLPNVSYVHLVEARLYNTFEIVVRPPYKQSRLFG
jgi:hypothetical protein